jgi:hypothetical protein
LLVIHDGAEGSSSHGELLLANESIAVFVDGAENILDLSNGCSVLGADVCDQFLCIFRVSGENFSALEIIRGLS